LKVFLGNSPWKKPGFYGVRAGSRWPHFEKEGIRYMPFPFYLAYATAMLEQEGIDCKLLDGIAEDISDEEFYARISDFQPDIIVTEVSTSSIDRDLEVGKELADRFPNSKKVFVGPHINMYEPAFLVKYNFVDFCIQGEYEQVLRNLVISIRDGKDYSGILGLVFRSPIDDKPIANPRAPLISDLDILPFPNRKQLPMHKYHDCPGGIPEPSLQIWASRGCPYQCIFCAWPQIMYGSNKYRTRSPKLVVDEIELCVKEYGIKSIYFDDDTFNIGKKRILELCDEMKKRGLNLPWAVMARADTADEEMLIAMKSAGLIAIKYGVESGNQDIVNACKKNLELKKVEQVVKITKKLGINMHLTFTFGLPGETWDTVKETIRFAKKLNPDTVQFSITTPFPGSSYFEELDKKGWLISKNYTEYDGYNIAVIRTEHLDNKALESALKLACKEWDKHKMIRSFLHTKYIKKALLHPIKGYKKAIDLLRA